jgi:chromosome segregation ATPase
METEQMEFEQIIKRLDWLDEEHRKGKVELDNIMEKLANNQGELKLANKKIRELTNELSKLSTASARIDLINSTINQQRVEILKYVDDMDNKDIDRLPEAEKRFQIKFDNLNKSILELRKLKEPIAEIKNELKNTATETVRLYNQTSEWEPRFQEIVKSIEEIKLAQKAAEGPRLQDSKRISELQGTITAAKKRMDEIREKNDLFPDSIRRIETRLNEIITSEAERRQSQINFLETQARLQIDRDRALKDMEEHLDIIRTQTGTMDRQLQEWDTIQRAAKRAQETYEDLVHKFERRINEISEMQRLAEDRFRQEWVTFKADDQKRWTSYTLSQDEIYKDTRNNAGKLEERLTALEDLVQLQQDVLLQTKDSNEQFFQGMLAQIHELLTAYERIMSTN